MKPKYNIGDEVLINEPGWENTFFSIVAIAQVTLIEDNKVEIVYIIGIKDCDKYLFPDSWTKGYNVTFAEYYKDNPEVISILDELSLKDIRKIDIVRFYGVDEDQIIQVKTELDTLINNIDNELSSNKRK